MCKRTHTHTHLFNVQIAIAFLPLIFPICVHVISVWLLLLQFCCFIPFVCTLFRCAVCKLTKIKGKEIWLNSFSFKCIFWDQNSTVSTDDLAKSGKRVVSTSDVQFKGFLIEFFPPIDSTYFFYIFLRIQYCFFYKCFRGEVVKPNSRKKQFHSKYAWINAVTNLAEFFSLIKNQLQTNKFIHSSPFHYKKVMDRFSFGWTQGILCERRENFRWTRCSEHIFKICRYPFKICLSNQEINKNLMRLSS